MKSFFLASLGGALLLLGTLTGCQQDAEPVEEAPAVETPASTPAEPLDETMEADTLLTDTLETDTLEAPVN